MSFIIQYLILRKLLNQIFQTIQTPSSFRLPYDSFKVFPLPQKIQWKYCYILNSLGLVELSSSYSKWYIRITTQGCQFLFDCKLLVIKAVSSVILAAASAVLGFICGNL